jgi:hypothetical protein
MNFGTPQEMIDEERDFLESVGKKQSKSLKTEIFIVLIVVGLILFLMTSCGNFNRAYSTEVEYNIEIVLSNGRTIERQLFLPEIANFFLITRKNKQFLVYSYNKNSYYPPKLVKTNVESFKLIE